MNNTVWFKVIMTAEEHDIVVMSSSYSEYLAIKKFLSQIKDRRCVYSWVGGHWAISDACNSKADAEKISMMDIPE